jgi:hypothetical protein
MFIYFLPASPIGTPPGARTIAIQRSSITAMGDIISSAPARSDLL